MSDTPSIAAIVEGLSEAQKRAMLWLYGPHQGRPQGRRWQGADIDPEASASVMRSLERRALVSKRGSAGWPIYFSPTPLGLSVCTALQEQSK